MNTAEISKYEPLTQEHIERLKAESEHHYMEALNNQDDHEKMFKHYALGKSAEVLIEMAPKMMYDREADAYIRRTHLKAVV